MSSKDQLSTKTGTHRAQPLPEGYIMAQTSGGNTLYFESPAELNEYMATSAAQMNIKR